LFDPVVKNAIVIDGTGNPWFKAEARTRRQDKEACYD
jgi:N-acyl-D-aspartate/D-glutamate deacylase